ncbi:MAG: hypothetical protein ACM3SR_10120 [Ignavibacteriales bacterium]
MDNANKKKAGWKQKAVHEIIDYFINFIYLALFFGLFTWYRRLVLAEYHIAYLNYSFSVIEALVLAKIIMIGDVLKLGRGLQGRPLIFPTLYNTVVFSVWVWLFAVLEHMVDGLLRGKGLAGGFDEIMGRGKYELLARCMVVFFAFIPFFAFRELGRVLGEGKLRELFFRRRADTESDLPTGSTPHPSI